MSISEYCQRNNVPAREHGHPVSEPILQRFDLQYVSAMQHLMATPGRRGNCSEAGDRFNVLISGGIDHIDCIVADMCDIEPICFLMDIGVIEPSRGPIWREFDTRPNEAPSL
jgi:hypothetical protein